MAKCTFKAGDEYALKLSRLSRSYEETAKKAIYAGAGIVADKIHENLEGVLSDESTGQLEASFGITPILQDKNGDWNAKVGFDGYDSKGVPNQLKARALESGTSTQRKRPFVAPAVRATRKAAQQAMGKVIDEEFEKQMRR